MPCIATEFILHVFGVTRRTFQMRKKGHSYSDCMLVLSSSAGFGAYTKVVGSLWALWICGFCFMLPHFSGKQKLETNQCSQTKLLLNLTKSWVTEFLYSLPEMSNFNPKAKFLTRSCCSTNIHTPFMEGFSVWTSTPTTLLYSPLTILPDKTCFPL